MTEKEEERMREAINAIRALQDGFANAKDYELGRLIGRCITAGVGLEVSLAAHEKSKQTP